MGLGKCETQKNAQRQEIEIGRQECTTERRTERREGGDNLKKKEGEKWWVEGKRQQGRKEKMVRSGEENDRESELGRERIAKMKVGGRGNSKKGEWQCSQIAGYAAPISERRCPRSRANSVSGCLDDRGAGVSNAKLDFRVLERRNKDDGPNEESGGGERGDCLPEREPDENIPELPKTTPEDPDRVRDTGDRRSQEVTEETPKRRHVPGGAWLSKAVAGEESESSWETVREGVTQGGGAESGGCRGDGAWSKALFIAEITRGLKTDLQHTTGAPSEVAKAFTEVHREAMGRTGKSAG
ncbi:hypothetical protein NDU88_005912 [Pleurodeles waltl]|uniref:Uncharacterized protein n=1 Tax=Pleurodeles waltl TaxID=8319 RepID=A0AAV7ULB4_PLEWA|nr:hypothetical protein NDU88_005912 [Pleurodeles waltl]